MSKSAPPPLTATSSTKSLGGLGLGFFSKSSRSSSNKSSTSNTPKAQDSGSEGSGNNSRKSSGCNSKAASIHEQQKEDQIDGVAKGGSHTPPLPPKTSMPRSGTHISVPRPTSSRSASSKDSIITIEKQQNDKQDKESSKANEKAKTLKWLPRPEIQSRYIYATPGRLMMDGRVANLDTIISSSPLLQKSNKDDDWQPAALAEFAAKQPHMAREAGMSATSLATTFVDAHGNPISEGDQASIRSTIEEESESKGEDWETETDRYGWEEEHISMTSSQASTSSQYSQSHQSRRASTESERTIRGGDMDTELREQLEGLSIGQDIRSELQRRPPKDWKEQRERDNEGKKRGLLWRVLSMNAR